MGNPICQEAEETPLHLLTECHGHIRYKIKRTPPEPWEVTSKLKCINTLSFFKIVDYDDAPKQF
jgi:hypothetical protein